MGEWRNEKEMERGRVGDGRKGKRKGRSKGDMARASERRSEGKENDKSGRGEDVRGGKTSRWKGREGEDRETRKERNDTAIRTHLGTCDVPFQIFV